MKWIRPIVLLLALPFGPDAQLPPAEAEALRAQRKLFSQEALVKINQKEYRAGIPPLEECNRIQEKVGEINTPNTALTRPFGATEDDGLLTGLEAAHLNLHGTGLVILSACLSLVGDIHAGEGAMSLRRAFSIAGAQAVLASHWRVSDQATQALMQNFTAHWQSGMSRTAALRKAQLELRQSEDHASPFFWAAFTLTGQWR